MLTNVVSPLHMGLYCTIAARGNLDLHVVYLNENESGRRWSEVPDRMTYSYEILSRRLRPRNRPVKGWRLDRLVRRVLRRRPQVIFSCGIAELEVAVTLMVTRSLKIPDIIVTASGPTDSRRESRAADALRHWAYRRYSGAIVPGPRHADYIVGLGMPRDRIFEAPYAVPGPQYRESARQPVALPGKPSLLFVGRLTAEKGVDLLIDAMSQVHADVHLTIVGEGPLEADLRARAEASPAQDRITFRGFVRREDLGALYAGADLTVVPSITEPWGLVVNEAMEVGTPVVASDHVGSASVLVRPGISGELFRSGDRADLVAALQRTWSTPDRLEALGRGAREVVGCCTFEVAAAAWEEAAGIIAGTMPVRPRAPAPLPRPPQRR
jgi:glycosyltransferase involved in cell wall biosynthesis